MLHVCGGLLTVIGTNTLLLLLLLLLLLVPVSSPILFYHRPPFLHRFLAEKKRDGYAVLGLEQSTNSVCITQFTFPARAVILLGKEKEGVPAHLLQMLDCCVEIPQFGVTRSLNVHVSGAVMVWEYTKQRMADGAI